MKKKLICLILALAMVVSLCCSAGAAPLRTVNVTGDQSYTYAFQVLTLVNQERAREGLKPLTMDVSLLDTAMLRAAECSILFDAQHTRPDGTSCFTANELMYGENIACGYATPEAVMNGWMNSSGHRANILNEGYATIGIGCVKVDGVMYWVQDFGYSGTTEAKAADYSDSSHTWSIQVSDEIDSDYVQVGSLIYRLKDGEAAVYLCDESVSGTVTIASTVEGCPVIAIDDAAFAGCEGITGVSIPDSVTSIGYNAFYGCLRLSKVSIPASVTFVGVDAFVDTLAFRDEEENGLVYLDNWLVYADFDLEGSLTVEEGTRGIAEMAVLGCDQLTDVTIPGSVWYINHQAFSGCTSLSSITFEGSAPIIGGNAFENVTAEASCPYWDPSWQNGALKDYGGTLTWLVPRFVDLPDTAWYTPYANRAADLGLMSGVGEHRFAPLNYTSRAMLVQILYAQAGKPEVEGENPFTDVGEDQWYADAVQWAYENGVTGGTGPDTFSPNKNVTREEIAVFLYAYCGRPEADGDLSAFRDKDEVHGWAVRGVTWATQNGVISGAKYNDGTLLLMPRKTASRAEAATMMVGFYDWVTGDSGETEEPEETEETEETEAGGEEELTPAE